MPNYNQAHAFYAGVDRHARSMFVLFSTLAAKPSSRTKRDTTQRTVPVLRKTVVGSCRGLVY
jgi:hypothetical protein